MKTTDKTGNSLKATVNYFLDQIEEHKKQGATVEEIDKAFAKAGYTNRNQF